MSRSADQATVSDLLQVDLAKTAHESLPRVLC
jgi:hypothetical protein